MAVDSNRIQAIFLLAVEAADALARAQILGRECGADIELRQRVETLLAAHDASGGILDRGLVSPVTTVDQPRLLEQPGSRIGPYKLLQQIGEGGMGVVFLAEQLEPVERKVALKVIKPGMDTHRVVARFEAERQALALMDHPNITRVLDAGATQTGRPYFVMELVKGVPINRYCDEHRLTPVERLALFVPVCQAVQHAHQKGIIHRDLKPTNILVARYDSRPVPKVIDFGVAKALGPPLTERTLFTDFGSIIGTLEYMSPEQAELNALDVDTRSDVYSLGVVLYELLAGSTPLDGRRLTQAAILEALRVIREEEPPRPSTRLSESKDSLASISAQRHTEPAELARLLRGELDWIVMKALDKDRARRYETADGLARDLQRYLADEAVEACPPTAAYRVRKFGRKHRRLLATAAAFMGLLLIAAVVSTWLAVEAKQAEATADGLRSAAEAAEEQTARERDHAEREWRRAEDAARRAKASAAERAQALDRLMVARGIHLAEQGDLFTGLLWLARPLERGGLTPEEDRTLRTRFACYLRNTPGRPVLRHLFFHDEWLSEVAFSADARRLLTVSGGSVRVWDLQRGDCLATLAIHTSAGTPRITPDGTRVLVADERGVWIWDVSTSQLVGCSLLSPEGLAEIVLGGLPQSPWQALSLVALRQWLTHEAEKAAATISPDCRQVLITRGSQVLLYDLGTGRLLQRWNKPSGFVDASFSPDGGRVLLNGASLEIRSAHPGRGASSPVKLSNVGLFRCFSHDGRRIVTVAEDKVMVWDATSGKAIGPVPESEWESGPDLGVEDLGPDARILGRRMGSVFQAGTLGLWDLDQGRKTAERRVTASALLGVFFGPDGRQVATMDDGTMRLWSVPSLDPSAPRLTSVGPLQLKDDWIFRGGFRFSPDARMCATAAADGTVQVWDLAGPRPFQAALKSRPTDLTRRFDQRIRRSTILNVGTMTMFPPSMPWNASLESVPPALRGQKLSLAISPDETRLLTIVPLDPAEPIWNGPSTAQLWDSATGAAVGRPLAFNQTMLHAEFSPDSRHVVTVSSDGTRLWNARSGLPMGEPFQDGDVLHATFSGDGALLVTSRGNQAQVWKTDSRQPQGKALVHASHVNRAAFSSDRKWVATASADYTARLWDAMTGDPVGPPLAHPGQVVDVAFSPDGLMLATEDLGGSSDGHPEARLWDVRTHQEMSPAILGTGARPDTSEAFLFTADGRALVGWNGGLHIDMSPAEAPASDLMKLAQLYACQRFDAGGGLLLLSKDEYRVLWNELRAKCPQEFTVRDESALDWRVEQLEALSTAKNVAGVTLHRGWLARELAAAGWHPGAPPDSSNRIRPWLQRVLALALYGREGEATAAASVLASQRTQDPNALHDCARVFALAAKAGNPDQTLTDSYTASAIDLLRKAVKAGFKEGQLLREDPDLEALGGRKDFIDLLHNLAEKP